MAAKNTDQTTVTTEVVEEVTIPHQAEPVDEVVEVEVSKFDKVKKLVRNKKVLAGAASVALIVVGAVVASKFGDGTIEVENPISE